VGLAAFAPFTVGEPFAPFTVGAAFAPCTMDAASTPSAVDGVSVGAFARASGGTSRSTPATAARFARNPVLRD
jgi:hypothetical protein